MLQCLRPVELNLCFVDLCPQVQDEDLCSAASVCRGPLRTMEGKHKSSSSEYISSIIILHVWGFRIHLDTYYSVCVGVQNRFRHWLYCMCVGLGHNWGRRERETSALCEMIRLTNVHFHVKKKTPIWIDICPLLITIDLFNGSSLVKYLKCWIKGVIKLTGGWYECERKIVKAFL